MSDFCIINVNECIIDLLYTQRKRIKDTEEFIAEKNLGESFGSAIFDKEAESVSDVEFFY